MEQFKKIDLENSDAHDKTRVNSSSSTMQKKKFNPIKILSSIGVFGVVLIVLGLLAFFMIVIPAQRTLSSAQKTYVQAKKTLDAAKKQNIELVDKELEITKKDIADTK